MPYIPGYNFILGINQGWFSGQYDHDLGYNQYSIGRLYRGNLNLILPDVSPQTPYLSTLNNAQIKNEIEKIFADIANEGNFSKIVRIWAFERFEGLKFDKYGKVIDIDDDFLTNLVKVFDIANNHHVKIYLCLFDTWSLYHPPPTDEVMQDKTKEYEQLRETWQYLMRNLIFESNKLSSFFSNALVPLLNKINNHPALFAIDLLNEPEGMTQNDPFITMSNVRDFITSCSTFIHYNFSHVKISCGFKESKTAISESSKLSNLDFIDFHQYNATGKLENYSSANFSGKPCLVGECGYPEWELGNLSNQDKMVETMEKFLANADFGEYAGALPWVEKYPKKHTMLEKIRAYKSPIVLKNSNESHKKQEKKEGCFIATAALGTELDPNIQFLSEYREYVISSSKYRNQFAKLLEFYYWFSPPIAEYIKKHEISRSLIKYSVVYPFMLSTKILIKLFDKNFKI